MKHLLYAAFLATSLMASNPIWEDDQHFCHYKCCLINANLSQIEKLADELSQDNSEVKEEIKKEIKQIKDLINGSYPF